MANTVQTDNTSENFFMMLEDNGLVEDIMTDAYDAETGEFSMRSDSFEVSNTNSTPEVHDDGRIDIKSILDDLDITTGDFLNFINETQPGDTISGATTAGSEGGLIESASNLHYGLHIDDLISPIDDGGFIM
jgi:hypothetical protein